MSNSNRQPLTTNIMYASRSNTKSQMYTPAKMNVPTSALLYSQTCGTATTAPNSATKYTGTPIIHSALLNKENKLREVHQKYEREAQEVTKNYEKHYRDHLELGTSVIELQELLKVERNKVVALEDRLEDCYRQMQQQKREAMELARENSDLRGDKRMKEVFLSDYEMKITNIQHNANSVGFENDDFRVEVKRLSDLYNTKLREIEEKYKTEIKMFSEEIDKLRSQLKEKDIDNEGKIRSITRELEAKIRSFENQMREKDRIINESTSEIKTLKDFNLKVKMEFEEELRRQVTLLKDQERVRHEPYTKELENKLRQLELENDSLKKKMEEVVQESKNKEKMVKDIKARTEEQVSAYKREVMDLKDHISMSATEIERLQIEIREKEQPIEKLQVEILNLKKELVRQKEGYLGEINRLVTKNDSDIKRFQEYERHLRAKISDLERLLKVSEAECVKLKTDLDKLREQIAGNIHKTISQAFMDYGAQPI